MVVGPERSSLNVNVSSPFLLAEEASGIRANPEYSLQAREEAREE